MPIQTQAYANKHWRNPINHPIAQPYDMGEIRGSLAILELLFHIVLSIPIIKAAGMSLGFFNALCLFWLTMHAVDSVQLSAPEVVTGAYGASVTVSCQYDLQFKEYTKYWCKGQLYELCSIVVATPKGQQSDRSSIADDKDAGVFTVTMTSLKESDQEMYWCVIARPGRNVYTGVRLRVSHTVITTTDTPLLILEQYEISWWATPRWIFFILMLCCLASTHLAVWRITATRKIQLQQQFQHKNSNSYD
ncbi:CMRF35-like molecule 5 isoform X2 [Sander lucioperca]|uniref:CMRF35-like molecule 5 isoform X2 n=1 Tax=Sander lucioperca TaxID=283035 RepID=UPI00125DD54A|nr:CMRF35-like molecule 5 isoform X2 [Sander lucioperca]